MDDDAQFVGMMHGAIYILDTNRFFRIESTPDSHEIIQVEVLPEGESIEPVARFNSLFEAAETYRQASMQRTLGDVMAIFSAA